MSILKIISETDTSIDFEDKSNNLISFSDGCISAGAYSYQMDSVGGVELDTTQTIELFKKMRQYYYQAELKEIETKYAEELQFLKDKGDIVLTDYSLGDVLWFMKKYKENE